MEMRINAYEKGQKAFKTLFAIGAYLAKSPVEKQLLELVTKITDGNVSDEVFEIAQQEFTDEELIDLTLAITTINSYNRLNIAFRTPAGDYQPGQFAVAAH